MPLHLAVPVPVSVSVCTGMAMQHGAARRVNPGVRRTVWHRYTMAWSRLRWGYTPSTELCDRLAASDSPRRAHIVDPHYGRMLPFTPQAESSRAFEEGEAWSPSFFQAEAAAEAAAEEESD